MFENNKLKTGIRQLDNILEGGLPRGEFMLIGGRPEMGKTSLLKQIIRNNDDTVCLYISDYHCFEQLPDIVDTLCKHSNNRECYVVVDDIDLCVLNEEEVGLRLKNIAQKCNIPVIATITLPPRINRRKNKRPNITDFHKGYLGMEPSIEKDTDIILGVYRQANYDADAAYNPNAEILVIKNRHGKCRTVNMLFSSRSRSRHPF